MKAITHPIYRDYPEQPYISPERDLQAWVETPERFPYGVVEKRQMQRLPEGVLPGHIVMLWRVHFGNFTNETILPQYFEYRYGVDGVACLRELEELGYIERCGARETLELLNVPVLKRILLKNALDTSGKKAELLARLLDALAEESLGTFFSLRKFRITPQGTSVLEKYDAIIQRHGPKQ